MSESIDQAQTALSTTTSKMEMEMEDPDNSITDLQVGPTISSSFDDSETGLVDTFLSPRQRIQSAKSLEEEVTVPKTRVQSLVKGYEEHVLDKKPLSERTRKLLSRHSLPANTSAPLGNNRSIVRLSSRTSLGGSGSGGGEDALARARAAIERRGQARVELRTLAKARVRTDFSAMGASISDSLSEIESKEEGSEENEVGKVVSTSYTQVDKLEDASSTDSATSSLKENMDRANQAGGNVDNATPNENDPKARALRARAKAKERLDATMALLDGNTISSDAGLPAAPLPGESTSPTDQHDKPLNSGSFSDKLASRQRIADESSMSELDKRIEMEEARILAKQQQKNQDTRMLIQVNAENLNQEQLISEQAKRAELDKDKQLAKQRQREEEETRRQARARAARLEEERLAAEASAQLEILEREQSKQLQLEANEEEDARFLEEEQLSTEAAEQLKMMGQDERQGEANEEEVEEVASEDYEEGSQASMNFDPIISPSSSYTRDSGEIIEKLSGASSAASSIGQVDRMLFQGEKRDANRDDDSIFDLVESGSNEMELTTVNEPSSGKDQPSDNSLSAGPMWKLAKEEAAYGEMLKTDFMPRDAQFGEEAEELLDHSPSLESDISETFMPAEENPFFDSSNEYHHDQARGEDAWLQESETDEPSEWKGFKRQRMIYMVGVGTVLGIFLSLYSQTTCHFITGDTSMGDDKGDLSLYYGLNKFAPLDSAFTGYTYCLAYDSEYKYLGVFGMLATVFGMIPIIVICVYLHCTMMHKLLWVGSMWMFYLAFVCQTCTFFVFLTSLCSNGVECSMGPGAWASAISSIVWFMLSIEMKLNSPLIQPIQSGDGVVVIEKENVMSEVRRIWARINGETLRAPSLARTAMRKQRRARKSDKDISSYRPPAEIV